MKYYYRRVRWLTGANTALSKTTHIYKHKCAKTNKETSSQTCQHMCRVYRTLQIKKNAARSSKHKRNGDTTKCIVMFWAVVAHLPLSATIGGHNRHKLTLERDTYQTGRDA